MDSTTVFRLDGKVALITGGGGGLGIAMGRALAGAGSAVALADVILDKAEAAAQAIRSEGGKASAYAVDVTAKADVDRQTSAVMRDLGRIDILVNSAGITMRMPAETFDEAVWDRILAVNLKGTFLCCQAAARHMIQRGGGGKIINLASIAGVVGLPGTVAYCASKGGVVQITRTLALEWVRHGIQVNAIAPSWFDTAMGGLVKGDPDLWKSTVATVPAGRMGQPDELATAVLFLASPASGMVTGQILGVDGGFLAM
jgi:NAD(P)-dependent dehydrogenase (short-subunit alcohol dehydrogenase family)